MRHFVLSCKNAALLPPLENFQRKQTMRDELIVTFSNMATKSCYDQVIVNPPTSLKSSVWKYYGFPVRDGKYYGFPVRDGTTDKS